MRKRILLLGSGELGKEFVIAAQRLGLETAAADRYDHAPAMRVADHSYVVDMLDGAALEKIVLDFKPDIIVPEIEAIRTEKLIEFEKRGIQVAPCAKAAHLTMNRDAIRDLASRKLKLKTAKYAYAESLPELIKESQKVGFPCVIKPVMSSSGKGQSVAKSARDLERSWKSAVQGMRGDKVKVIVEEFIQFDSEVTLLTVRQKNKKTFFVNPIGHRQERGDYQESWVPAKISTSQLKKAKAIAKKVTDALGGYGLFGVEFFLTKKDVYFSELSPRPHDTGMVTLISQDVNEFELHLRAILGFPIPELTYYGPSASAVILAGQESEDFSFTGLESVFKEKSAKLILFGKPSTRLHRRMGVVLTIGKTVTAARMRAFNLAKKIKINYS
ncbi:MAG: formate-dependent phosphoribosylglycinamide formyltransferase [Pseudobdellovibrionaceae bacterium]